MLIRWLLTIKHTNQCKEKVNIMKGYILLTPIQVFCLASLQMLHEKKN